MDKQEEMPKGLKVMIFNNFVKTLKKDVSSKCTFIAPYKDSEGELTLAYRVSGEEHHISVPEDYDITVADRERIKNLIEETCQKAR